MPPLKGAGTAQAVTGGCLTEVSACADVFIAFCRGRVSRPGVPSALKSSICGIGGATGGGTPPLRGLSGVRRFRRGCGLGRRRGMACLARLAQARPFSIQTGTFRNDSLREGYIPPLPWCGVFIGGAVWRWRCRGRLVTAPTGSVGGADWAGGAADSRGRLSLRVLLVVRKKTASASGAHTGAPLRIISVVQCGIGGTAGGRTPPLRGLSGVRRFRWRYRGRLITAPTDWGDGAEKIAPFEGGWHGASCDWGLPDGSFGLRRCFQCVL